MKAETLSNKWNPKGQKEWIDRRSRVRMNGEVGGGGVSIYTKGSSYTLKEKEKER